MPTLMYYSSAQNRKKIQRKTRGDYVVKAGYLQNSKFR